MNLASIVSKRTACKFHEAGIVFVDKNHRIISLGYNGPTEGDYHCLEAGCAKVDGDPITKKLRRCRGAHAEMNGIINAQDPTRLRGATAYSLLFPCYDCMKAFNNAGISEVVYVTEYKRIQTGGEKHEEENEARELAEKRGMKIRKYEGNLVGEELLNGTATSKIIEEPKLNTSHPEYQYLNLMQELIDKGVEQVDAGTGVKTYSLFGKQFRFDLSKGFPLLTTKKVYWKGVLQELYWFISGQKNIKYLVDNNVHIWDDYPYRIYREKINKGLEPEMTKEEFIAKIATDNEFAIKHGDLPHVYGDMWRHWPTKTDRTIDQLKWLVETVRKDKSAHNAIVNSWNPEYLYEMASPGEACRFPICHNMFQINTNGGKLSLQLYQRSCDVFLGVPFNIASYALLTIILAKITGNQPGEFIHTFGDIHYYENHLDAVKEQLQREPLPFPTIKIDPNLKEIDDFRPEMVELVGYESHPAIKAELTPVGGIVTKDWKDFVQKDKQIN